MGQWALGGALGDGSRIEECEAWHGSNHCAGWTGVAENATVWVDIRAEQMLPAGVSGTCVFTPTYDGATVNLKIRCDKAVANYGVNTGTSIYAGGGSALLMHDTGGTWAQFNVYDSDLNQQSFQINDDNGPVTITNSALDGYFGTVAPITSGITFDGCTLPFGIPLLLNTTDVVTLNNCTINHLYTRAFNGTIIIDNCDFSIENSGVGHTGNLHIVTNGLANTAFKLTFTDNRITSHASNYYNLFASLRKDNIIEWDRNRWLGPRNCGAILSFDTDNNGVGDGVFYACEGGLNYATSQLSQGLDLNTPTDEASTAGLIAATIQPSTLVARLDMNEPSGGLGYLIRNKAAANYLFIASGSSSTRWEAGPAADSPSISMNGAGRFNRTDGAYILNPVGGAWDFTIAFWLKATAGVNDGMWLISQYNASRTGDRLGIAGGWSGTGTPRDKMIFYVNDGVERIGATNASNYVITYATGAWMHIAIVVKTTALNKSTPYYYVNGVASGNALEFDHPTSYGTWTDFSFGNFNTSLGGYKGSIAGPLCIWNSELTAGEIETLAGV
jgi:hypothetical protein